MVLASHFGRESTAPEFSVAGSVILLFGAEITQVSAGVRIATDLLRPFGIPARPIVGRYTITETRPV